MPWQGKWERSLVEVNISKLSGVTEDGGGGVFGNLAQSQFLKNAWILSIAIEILLLNNYCMKFEPLIYAEKVGTNPVNLGLGGTGSQKMADWLIF